MNASVLFLLGVVFLIPLVVGVLVWRAFRSQARSGVPFAPEGKLRWEAFDRENPK